MKGGDFLKVLQRELGFEKVKVDEPMNRHTTFRIGGLADFYFEARTVEEVIRAVEACRRLGIGYFVLGMGANLLVSDQGIRGLVIRPVNNNVEVVPSDVSSPGFLLTVGRHYQPYDTENYLRFDDLDDAEPSADTLVKVGAGVSLPVLIGMTLDLGLTGLQSFAGIPASVGGSIYNNIHGGTKLFDQFVDQVVLLDREGRVRTVGRDEMDFGYDSSRIQKTGEVVLEAVLKLSHGDVKKARWVRQEWLRRKLQIQPQINCPGCVFKNLTPEEAERIEAPSVGAGWVLDIGLGLKGTRVGGVFVSEKHANFFVNAGGGKASDVLELIKICKEKAKEKFGLNLREEIQIIGEF